MVDAKAQAKLFFKISFIFIIDAIIEISKFNIMPYSVGFVGSIAFDVYIWRYYRAVLLKGTDANRSRFFLDVNLILKGGIVKVHYVNYILQIITCTLFISIIVLAPIDISVMVKGALSQILIAALIIPTPLIKRLEKERLI